MTKKCKKFFDSIRENVELGVKALEESEQIGVEFFFMSSNEEGMYKRHKYEVWDIIDNVLGEKPIDWEIFAFNNCMMKLWRY